MGDTKHPLLSLLFLQIHICPSAFLLMRACHSACPWDGWFLQCHWTESERWGVHNGLHVGGVCVHMCTAYMQICQDECAYVQIHRVRHFLCLHSRRRMLQSVLAMNFGPVLYAIITK